MRRIGCSRLCRGPQKVKVMNSKRNCIAVLVYVDGVRLCLCTAVTNESTVHRQGDIHICMYAAKVELYWQGKPEDFGEKRVPVPLIHHK
jgi:hypothetical protein